MIYWLLLPYSNYLDKYTHVSTLWDTGGWFRTVAYEYSRLSVRYGVLPYTKVFPEYPFSTLEYPFLAGFLFYAIYLVFGGSLQSYFVGFQGVNIGFESGTVALIYLLARRRFSSTRSVALALLYTSSPSILWFSMSRYDAIPSFFALLSLYLFVGNNRKWSYVAATIGLLLRVYPILLFLVYLKHGISTRKPLRFYLEIVGTPLAVVALAISPLLMIEPSSIPRLLLHYATFSWNWESIYGVADQFLRPIFPSLTTLYLHPESMRAIFVVASASVILLDLSNEWKLLNGVAFSILAWLQTQWFFSPQYVVWIFPLILILAVDKRFVALYVMAEAISILENSRPLYDVMPFTEFQYVIYATSLRIVLFSILAVAYFVRVEQDVLARRFLRFQQWYRRQAEVIVGSRDEN